MSVFDTLKKLFRSKPKSNLPIIDVAKRFEILARVGQGSMSKVYRARDRMSARVVCLKVLDKIKTAKFDARFPGLKRPSEGAILTQLRHPHVVHASEHGLTKEGEPYLVMEFVEGNGLNFWIETSSPQLQGKRLQVLSQLAEGIGYIHRQGFLHRDICPRNVMINTEGMVKIIDFGLTIPYKPEFCKPGNRTGTSHYLAPELIKRQTTDHRVELFALGVTAFETITGGLPWEGTGSEDILKKHMNIPGRDPRDLRPDLDGKTAQFLIKAIQRDPRDRFQTAEAFREALEALPAQ